MRIEWLTATGGRAAAGAQVGGGIEATDRPRNTQDTVHMCSYAVNSRTQDTVRMGQFLQGGKNGCVMSFYLAPQVV